MNKLDFKNQNIIVTGGSSGIGEACVFRLVESGAKVIIWDKNVNQINKKLEDLISKNLVSIYSIDITRYEDILNIFNKIIKEYKKIDGLINSAGYAGKNTTVIDYPVDEWKKIHDVNVNGTFFTNKVIASHMKNNNYGRIVNVASIAGKEGNPNACAYSSSKAAVIGFTKSLGKELATSGISVNCVTPAAVKTPIFDQVAEFHQNFMLSKIPMGRFGQPEEIASLICWLCSQECSFTTGGVFDISGGRATY